MVTLTPQYGSPTALTQSFASMTSSATSGKEGTQTIDNKDTSDAVDILVGGKFTTGSGVTGGYIEVYAYASYDDVEFGGNLAGTGNSGMPDGNTKDGLTLLQTLAVASGESATAFKWGPVSLLNAFGFVPVRWGIWITQLTGAALHATATNHEIVYVPVKLEA